MTQASTKILGVTRCERTKARSTRRIQDSLIDKAAAATTAAVIAAGFAAPAAVAEHEVAEVAVVAEDKAANPYFIECAPEVMPVLEASIPEISTAPALHHGAHAHLPHVELIDVQRLAFSPLTVTTGSDSPPVRMTWTQHILPPVD